MLKLWLRLLYPKEKELYKFITERYFLINIVSDNYSWQEKDYK